MRNRLLLPLLVLLLLFPTITGQAQGLVRLEALEVELWPEYDRPDMLVLYHIFLPSDQLPSQLTFRIPKSAKIHKVAVWQQEDGNLYETEYDNQLNGDWQLVTFEASTVESRLEYYDPGLQKEGATRQYRYHWAGDYAVDSMALVIQQPWDASDMLISPQPDEIITGQDTLTYYSVPANSLAAGQTFDLALDYQKASETLTSSKIQVRPSESIPGFSLMRILPWALGVLGIGLIVGGVWWYWRLGRPQVKTRKRHRRPIEPQKESQNGEDGVYCHHCGRRAASGDIYCRTCGTHLRTD